MNNDQSIEELRQKGYAVVVFPPESFADSDIKREDIERELICKGGSLIEEHRGLRRFYVEVTRKCRSSKTIRIEAKDKETAAKIARESARDHVFYGENIEYQSESVTSEDEFTQQLGQNWK